MAKVKWTKKADSLFYQYVKEALWEYGKKTSKKWMDERVAMADRLSAHPLSYTPESLLKEKSKDYRSCIVLGRFKIIHYYAKASDTVYITDIWDTRMSPETLRKRIK